MSINELFNNDQKETVSARTLNGTTELTNICNNVAVRIIREMEEQIDIYRDRIAKSANDSKEMDALLEEFRPWCDIEADSILWNLDDNTVEAMLKSQQSKRSRTRSKAMTLDNYRTLMTATLAESMLREIYNKPKASTLGNRRGALLDYTAAELEYYAADQEALRKEIRNVQSKKSIMKSKADFDESSEQWLALLKAEQMLKDLRTNVTVVDETKNKLTQLLNGVDLEHLKAADSKELLSKIVDAITDEPATTEEVNDVHTEY